MFQTKSEVDEERKVEPLNKIILAHDDDPMKNITFQTGTLRLTLSLLDQAPNADVGDHG